MVPYIMIAAAIVCVIIALILIKKGKNNVITPILALLLLFGGGSTGYFGFDTLNNTPHEYVCKENKELPGQGKHQIQLKRTDGSITEILVVDQETSLKFIVGETYNLTNSEISEYNN